MDVAVIGASDNPERYAFKAVSLLKEKGHRVFPVHPRLKSVQSINCYTAPEALPKGLHTITLYVSPKRLLPMIESIAERAPQRVIFNPGTESEEAESFFNEHGIKTLRACTLVLLTTEQF